MAVSSGKFYNIQNVNYEKILEKQAAVEGQVNYTWFFWYMKYKYYAYITPLNHSYVETKA